MAPRAPVTEGFVAIVGKGTLSDRHKTSLEFADIFEDKVVRQGRDEDRDIEATLTHFWADAFPRTALDVLRRDG